MLLKFAESMKEVGNSLIVKYTDGSNKNFDAVELAMSWLRMSNDSFYRLYGFNYVPSQRIQSIARAKIAY